MPPERFEGHTGDSTRQNPGFFVQKTVPARKLSRQGFLSRLCHNLGGHYTLLCTHSLDFIRRHLMCLTVLSYPPADRILVDPEFNRYLACRFSSFQNVLYCLFLHFRTVLNLPYLCGILLFFHLMHMIPLFYPLMKFHISPRDTYHSEK